MKKRVQPAPYPPNYLSLRSAFAAVLAYAGLTAADLTTWESVGALLCNAVRNPYCLFLVLSSVWNAVNDPTTKGVADSERARSYDTPSR